MNNILSGHNFANISDFIFAKEIKTENGRKHVVYPFNPEYLSENDIVYCKTDYVLDLFSKISNLKTKIKLITHESDYEINEKLFKLKPECIKKWFAININYENENLISIPLGIANNYCNITLKFENIKKSNNKKEKLLYVNHRVNTFPPAREWIYQHFQTNNWCTVDQPNLSLENFEEKLNKHMFMICPRGNGIDTHRLWECLYSGVVPVVENHINNKNLKDLPILFVDSFKQIDEQFLLKNKDMLSYNLEKLDINWWKKNISES